MTEDEKKEDSKDFEDKDISKDIFESDEEPVDAETVEEIINELLSSREDVFSPKKSPIPTTDFFQLVTAIQELKEVLDLGGEMIDELAPTIFEMLAPLSREYYSRTAKGVRFYFDSLVEEGFTEKQALAIILHERSAQMDVLKDLWATMGDVKIKTE